MEWSLEINDESLYEVGAVVLGILQDRYKARIQGYDVSFDNRVSVEVTLPSDRRTRRIVLNWAQVDRNHVFGERVRELVASATTHSDRVQEFLRRTAQHSARRTRALTTPTR
jgi:hypothetical protein